MRRSSEYAELLLRLRASLDEGLRSRGVRVDEVLTLAAPLQVIGRFAGGECFYFRSRHDTASIDVWDSGLDLADGPPPPMDDLLWSSEVEEDDEDGASSEGDSEVVRLIGGFFDRYLAEATAG
jgi:hypothetical protein